MKKFKFTNLYIANHFSEIIELLKTFNQDTTFYGYGDEILFTDDAAIGGFSILREFAAIVHFPEIYCLVEDQHALQFKLSLP